MAGFCPRFACNALIFTKSETNHGKNVSKAPGFRGIQTGNNPDPCLITVYFIL